MSYSEVTFGVILRALRHQWKVLLGCILAFSAIGVIAGAIWADEMVISPEGGTVSWLTIRDASEIACDADYYVAVGNLVAEAHTRARNCLLLVNDGTITEDQRGDLKRVQSRLDAWEQTMIPIWQELSSGNAYVPEGTVEDAIELCEMRLQRAKDHVLFAQRYDMENLSVYEHEVAVYTKRLQQLTYSPEQVAQQSEAMSTRLGEACDALTEILVELQTVVTVIAESNHLDLFICYDEREDGYYVDLETELLREPEEIEWKLENEEDYEPLIILHNHGYRSERDAFATLALFCTLVGICVGVFFAICRESKMESKRKAE